MGITKDLSNRLGRVIREFILMSKIVLQTKFFIMVMVLNIKYPLYLWNYNLIENLHVCLLRTCPSWLLSIMIWWWRAPGNQKNPPNHLFHESWHGYFTMYRLSLTRHLVGSFHMYGLMKNYNLMTSSRRCWYFFSFFFFKQYRCTSGWKVSVHAHQFTMKMDLKLVILLPIHLIGSSTPKWQFIGTGCRFFPINKRRSFLCIYLQKYFW